MPLSRYRNRPPRGRYNRFRHGRTRRVGAGMSAPRWTRRRRVTQNLTRSIQWFKRVQAIQSDTAGNLGFETSTLNVDTTDDFVTYGTLYSQFKVLKMICKFYPANVGGESMQIAGTGAAAGLPMFQRGDALTYIGKQASPGSGITDLIMRSSARLLQPRRFHKRWVNRPYGYTTWGEVNPLGAVTTQDPWDDESGIRMVGQNFTPSQAPGQQNFFYVVTYWKVLFRSRQE